jgi:hypothetical protein
MMDRNATECPKCGLKAKTLLHRFCTHQQCPVREMLNSETPSKDDDGPDNGGEGA